MTRDEIRAAVLDAIVAVIPEAHREEVDMATPIRDQLDMDSMDFINFVVELDERLGVSVPESEYGQLQSVEDTVEYLERALAGSALAGGTEAAR
jgi:acyl carrier protein